MLFFVHVVLDEGSIVIYLFSHFFNLFAVYAYQNARKNRSIKLVILLFLIVSIAFLPAFQSNVGTDYHNYTDLFTGSKNLEFYFSKKEYFFYYLVTFLRYIDAGPQSLFVCVSLIQSALLCNILRVLSLKKFNIVLLFFLISFITNMLHNQMNLLRAYVAAYAFVSAYAYRSKGSFFKCFLFFIFGMFWHRSILAFTPFLFLPQKFWDILFCHRIKLFLVTFFVFALGLPLYFSGFLIDNFFPMYHHYLTSEYAKKEIPYLNIATKMIYTPLYLLFLYTVKSKKVTDFSSFEVAFFGIWLVTVNSYLLLLYTPLVSRFLHFSVFFSIFPIYYIFITYRKNIVMLLLLILYVSLPYFLKVVFFHSREYSYSSIFH